MNLKSGTVPLMPANTKLYLEGIITAEEYFDVFQDLDAEPLCEIDYAIGDMSWGTKRTGECEHPAEYIGVGYNRCFRLSRRNLVCEQHRVTMEARMRKFPGHWKVKFIKI